MSEICRSTLANSGLVCILLDISTVLSNTAAAACIAVHIFCVKNALADVHLLWHPVPVRN